MAAGNIFAGVLEGLGKALSGAGMAGIEQKNKLEAIDRQNEIFMSPDDQKAIMWARSNPNDPRAQVIMQRLGRK